MRIISGIYKSRKIVAPKNLPVRPTTDMAKESLFNILNNHYFFAELIVLDLFAGTGNISYEFASRGCENITCVDLDFGCIKFINQTAQTFNMPIQSIKSDVFKYLEKATLKANVIFADPPYGLDQKTFEKVVLTVFEKEALQEDGMMIIEHSKYTKLDHLIHFSFKKSYGGSIFSFFEIGKSTDEEIDDENLFEDSEEE